MKNARYAHCSVLHSNALYICGGREYGDDETGILSACERYDFSSGKWKTIPNMMYPRSGGVSVAYGEHIYVFGGYTGKG